MGREINETLLIKEIVDRINRLRRLQYFIENSKTTEEIKEIIFEFLDTTLSNVEFILLDTVIEDYTPADFLSTGRLQKIAKALGIPRYRYLSRNELLVLIEKEGEVYGKTFTHPNAASKNNIRRILARRAKESKDTDSKEV